MNKAFLPLMVMFATTTVLGQQQQQQQQQIAAATNPLGTRYSASTDVSHISFNSPLVTYGAALNEIQLPAVPIQPENLKQVPPNLLQEPANSEPGQLQQLQAAPLAKEQQYISVQQFPANPQRQINDQAEHLQAAQRYAQQQQLPLAQPQQPFALPQQYLSQQQFPIAQPQQAVSLPQQYPLAQLQQQYLATQPQQQQYLASQPQQQQPLVQQQYLPRLQSPVTNGYFATGPFAAQYSQPQNLLNRQLVPQPLLPQAQTAQLVSRVAFTGPNAGFSYGF